MSEFDFVVKPFDIKCHDTCKYQIKACLEREREKEREKETFFVLSR